MSVQFKNENIMEYRARRNSQSQQKEIEKYIKFFSIKALQCVVQSRVGTKVKTKCNPSARGLDWFNVSIISDELASNKLQSKVRDLFGKKIPGLSIPVCLDIILKTADGNFTVLESWQISTDTQQHYEENTKNHFSVYNKLSILLKSVISSSRLLPSYHLGRKNKNDFLLFCKIHTDIYELHHYELHNKYNIGSVSTPSGKLTIKVLYRNKIWLSGSIHPYTYDIIDTEALLLLTEGKNERETAFFQSVDMLENEIAIAASDISVTPQVHSSPTSPVTDSPLNYSSQIVFSGPSVGHIEEESRPIAAFVEPSAAIKDLESLDLPTLSEVPPFISLITEDNSDKNETNGKNVKESNGIGSTDITLDKSKQSNDSVQRMAEAVGFEDDFVLVELRPAFCTDDNSVGTLYRYCQSPTALDMFASLEREDKESECIDLDKQLERYQKELKDFQDFFKILN